MADDDIAEAMNGLRNEVGGEVLAELIDLYDASFAEHTTAIEASIDKNDVQAVAHHAHALIGTIANFRATEALRRMRAVEDSAKRGAPVADLQSLYAAAKTEAARVRAVIHADRPT